MRPPVSAPPPLRLATSGQRHARRRRRLISLTPLIDVVFILLVFFMLASSYLDWHAIDLNAPAQSSAGVSIEGGLLVEVRDDGVRLSGEVVELDRLAAIIAERLAEKPDQPVFVMPAAGVPLQQAVSVLDRLTEAGVVELSLVRGSER